MKRTYKERIEALANILIILVSILVVVVIVRQYLSNSGESARTGSPPGSEEISAGKNISVEGIDWSHSRKTVLLVLSSNCRYCTQSVEFYQKLVLKRQNGEQLRIIALFPHSVELGRRYLADHNVYVDDVKEVSMPQLGTYFTPTIILVDSGGKIVNSWVGKLQPDKENEIMSML